jgi:uncharacterized protein YecE (DUF72 family)
MARIFTGTSGWNYKHWKNGVFYAEGLKVADWLTYFASQFNSVEINNSFYRLPSEEAFEKWRCQVPKDFVFAVKASRFLTHIKRLKDSADPLDLFFSRSQHLRDTLGPVLFQLPPKFKCDLDRLTLFLATLRKHPLGKKCRAVLEVRDRSWLTSSTYGVLERYNICLCFADWREMPVENPVTADFVYVRRHYGKAGDGNYGEDELEHDVRKIRKWWKSNLDVYIYFNNDWKGYAIENARFVQQRI